MPVTLHVRKPTRFAASGAGGFFERAGLSEFPVTPLADADSMALLGSQFAHLPTRVLRGVADEAEGNPLALLEFAAVAAKPQDPAQLTRSSREVHTLFQTRVERLPDAARRLLLLAALDGSGSLGVLARASGGGGLDELGPAERDHLG